MKKLLFYTGLVSFFLSVHVQAQTVFFVSPRGNVKGNGTEANPFGSIQAAINQARLYRGNVCIYLMGGTYRLSRSVIFTTDDSRKGNDRLLIRNFKNQQVVITGAAALKLNWIPYKNGIWQAGIQKDIIFDELFVNGQLQHMARYPNYDSTAHYLDGTARDVLSKERIAGWKSPEGGYIHALHPSQWGDVHYKIKGKDNKGGVILEGGWQNNRPMGMSEKYRYAENIFEELDTANEWYYDKAAKILYYYPPKGLDIKKARIETPQIENLFVFNGNETNPVSNITISGVILTQTLRTFMQNKEPLLRSDWTIYRGGAVFFNGAINSTLQNCTLFNLGGNAVFFNNYNRNCKVSGCMIYNIGASGICFVGDPDAVRSPSFRYEQSVPLAQIDRAPGPKTNNYPADCTVFDNLLFNTGQVEKQSAGLELSMCQSIKVSHNTICDVPRAGINVSEGTWGGHIIEDNDIFNTVKETGDHGSFNSWGRDRYWVADKTKLDSIVKADFGLAMLDVVKPIILRHNRFRCDHGWDIDLDDGSSNYIISNNLCLNGGIKLREGVNRIVENNIMVNNTFHPHVWFVNSNDVFIHNVVSTGYLPINVAAWGKEVDYNVFPDSASFIAAQNRGTDKHSVAAGLKFIDPQNGDFRLKKDSKAFTTGFKNFPMNNFGVISPALKSRAKKVLLPIPLSSGKNIQNDEVIDFMGARIKNLITPGERSATGMDDIRGVYVINVAPNSAAAQFLKANDVILKLNSTQINKLSDLVSARQAATVPDLELTIFRNQHEIKQRVHLRKNE